jgi:hypothetical protein
MIFRKLQRLVLRQMEPNDLLIRIEGMHEPSEGQSELPGLYVARAFVRLRHEAAHYAELAQQLVQLEKRVGGHDDALQGIVTALRGLIEGPPPAPNRRIGFRR